MSNEQGNTTVYVTIGVLFVLLLLGGAAGSKPKPKPPAPKPLDNARAVLLAGGDGVTRTLVVPPCNAPVGSTERDVAAGRPPPNAVILELPAGSEPRAVLVPDCLEASAGVTASGSLPAAAFVLPIGTRAAANPTLQVGAQTQIIVPAGSRAHTIIVPPCSGAASSQPVPNQRGRQDVVLSPNAGTDRATAPDC